MSEQLAWVAFARLDGLTVRRRREILAAAPSPAAFFNGGDGLHARFQLTPKEIDVALQSAGREIEKALTLGAEILTPDRAEYPALLGEIPDPPPVLYALGDLAALRQPAVAVVGTRRASTYGRNMARQFARELSQAGALVVSGGARGIDAAAHEAVLESGGRTAVVAGTGLGVSYPPEHAPLYRQIASAGGLILSELPPDAEPLAWHFPQRNRIIAGISLGTLVIEGAERSGSLITARLAIEYSREVFAIPGNLTSGVSNGPNRLIRKGEAKLVQCVADLLEEIRPAPGMLPLKLAADEAAMEGTDDALHPALLALLPADDHRAFDDLQTASGLSAAQLAAQLVELQLAGRIEVLPGGRYARKD